MAYIEVEYRSTDDLKSAICEIATWLKPTFGTIDDRIWVLLGPLEISFPIQWRHAVSQYIRGLFH